MIKYLTIVLSVFLIACKSKPPQTFNTLQKREISKIIEAVIYQDSLPIFKTILNRDKMIDGKGKKTIRHSTSYPLSRDLRKLSIWVPDSTKKTLTLPNHDSISIFRLLGKFGLIQYDFNGKRVMSSKAYDYLLFQNTVSEKLSIENIFRDSLIFTTTAEQQKKRINGIPVRYYTLTVPILSPDDKQAYVEVTFNCSGTCGNAVAICLEKKDNKWQIVNRKTLWVS